MTTQTAGPEVGQPAPDFTLQSNTREQHTLSQFKGKKVVLAFYVLDFTGG